MFCNLLKSNKTILDVCSKLDSLCYLDSDGLQMSGEMVRTKHHE